MRGARLRSGARCACTTSVTENGLVSPSVGPCARWCRAGARAAPERAAAEAPRQRHKRRKPEPATTCSRAPKPPNLCSVLWRPSPAARLPRCACAPLLRPAARRSPSALPCPRRSTPCALRSPARPPPSCLRPRRPPSPATCAPATRLVRARARTRRWAADTVVRAYDIARPACVKGVTFANVQKPTAESAGDASSTLSGAHRSRPRRGLSALRMHACHGFFRCAPVPVPARSHARARARPPRRRRRRALLSWRARVALLDILRPRPLAFFSSPDSWRPAAALVLVLLTVGSLESFRLVNDRADKGLDTYLNKKTR